MARQDLDAAIAAYDAVLAIEPQNATAQLERQRALTLKDRLRNVR
jgi:lipoprotein NlpI